MRINKFIRSHRYLFLIVIINVLCGGIYLAVHHNVEAHRVASKSVRYADVNVNKHATKMLHYKYITQVGRGNAKDACEAASLKVALDHFKIDDHKSLDQFVNTIPHNAHDPEKGYTGNPYIFGAHSTMYPKAILKIAKREGAKKSYIIDDYHRRGDLGFEGHKASAKAFKSALFRGDPVVFEGSSLMQRGLRTKKPGLAHFKSDHTLVLYGYKKGRFYWVDPDHRKRFIHNHHGSTSVKEFMRIVDAPKRGPRAIAIGK